MDRRLQKVFEGIVNPVAMPTNATGISFRSGRTEFKMNKHNRVRGTNNDLYSVAEGFQLNEAVRDRTSQGPKHREIHSIYKV